MKYVYIAAAGLLLLLSSCIRKQVVLEVAGQRDSLQTVVGAKDSLINAVFEQINAIADNLARIRSRENLINTPDEEGVRRPTDEIRGDIEAIDRLLEQNRARIASLERTAAALRRADVKIGALEKTIRSLDAELAAKGEEIGRLHARIERMELEAEQLTEQVAEREAEVVRLHVEKGELEERVDRLHTVYYIVGSEKELRDAQIIDKQGFIGRTLTLGKAGVESFTDADSRLLTEIPVGRRRVTVVSSHPEGSYELVTGDDRRVEKLVVVDPDRFWGSSRVLVVSYR